MDYEAKFNELTTSNAAGTMSDRDALAFDSAMSNAHDTEREGVQRYSVDWYMIFVSTFNAWFDEN